jgi:hypothetical protein
VAKKKTKSPMQLSVSLVGDQRLTQNLILEVCEAAKRHGLEIPDIQVLQQPRVRPKVKLKSPRRSR